MKDAGLASKDQSDLTFVARGGGSPADGQDVCKIRVSENAYRALEQAPQGNRPASTVFIYAARSTDAVVPDVATEYAQDGADCNGRHGLAMPIHEPLGFSANAFDAPCAHLFRQEVHGNDLFVRGQISRPNHSVLNLDEFRIGHVLQAFASRIEGHDRLLVLISDAPCVHVQLSGKRDTNERRICKQAGYFSRLGRMGQAFCWKWFMDCPGIDAFDRHANSTLDMAWNFGVYGTEIGIG